MPFKSYEHFYWTRSARLMLSKASSILKRLLRIPVVRQWCDAYVSQIWAKYIVWFKTYYHYHKLIMGGRMASHSYFPCSTQQRVMQFAYQWLQTLTLLHKNNKSTDRLVWVFTGLISQWQTFSRVKTHTKTILHTTCSSSYRNIRPVIYHMTSRLGVK